VKRAAGAQGRWCCAPLVGIMPKGFRLRSSRTYRFRRGFVLLCWPALLVFAVSIGCGGPQKGEGSGGECFRDADCKEGLVCVDGECSSNVDSLVSVVEGPGSATMTAAGGAGGATATADTASTSGGMMGAGGSGAMGAGGNGAVGAGGAMAAS